MKPGDENLGDEQRLDMLEEQLTRDAFAQAMAYQPTPLSSHTAPGSSASSPSPTPFTRCSSPHLPHHPVNVLTLSFSLSLFLLSLYPCTHPVIHIQPLSISPPALCTSAFTTCLIICTYLCIHFLTSLSPNHQSPLVLPFAHPPSNLPAHLLSSIHPLDSSSCPPICLPWISHEFTHVSTHPPCHPSISPSQGKSERMQG